MAVAAPKGTMIDGAYSLKYDTKISSTQQGGMSWLFGGAPKSEAEVRDERYAGYVVSLCKVLADWRNNGLSASDALKHADHYMEKIMEVGRVDGDRARKILEDRGIDDTTRLNMQKDFQELKKACGQKVPMFNGERKKRWVCC